MAFRHYMKYVRNLGFDQKPNYKMLRGLFEVLFRELNYEDDNKYDWVVRKSAILERRALEEEAETHRKAQAELIK